MAKLVFDAYWTRFGRPEEVFPPSRYYLRRAEAGALDDCVEIQLADLLDPSTLAPIPGGLHDERAFGRLPPLEGREARLGHWLALDASLESASARVTERMRRFARISLASPVPHPWYGIRQPLHVLPVYPADLRPPRIVGEAGFAPHDLCVHYASVVGHDAALRRARAEHADAGIIRSTYEALARAVACLIDNRGSERPARDPTGRALGCLLDELGPDPDATWARMVWLNERADEPDFDPVWAEDLPTHRVVAVLAALGFEVHPR